MVQFHNSVTTFNMTVPQGMGAREVTEGVWETDSGIGSNPNYIPNVPPPKIKKPRTVPIYMGSPFNAPIYAYERVKNDDHEYVPCIICLVVIFLLLVGIVAIRVAVIDVKPKNSYKLICNISCEDQDSTYEECETVMKEGLIAKCIDYDKHCCDQTRCICRTVYECDEDCNWRTIGYVILLVFGILCLTAVFCTGLIMYMTQFRL